MRSARPVLRRLIEEALRDMHLPLIRDSELCDAFRLSADADMRRRCLSGNRSRKLLVDIRIGAAPGVAVWNPRVWVRAKECRWDGTCYGGK